MRKSLPLDQAYMLLNHGPTTLVSAAHGDRKNVMTAAWAFLLDFDPPKVGVIISQDSFTRALIEKSGEFVLSLPSTEQLNLAYALGHSSGETTDKLKKFKVPIAPASKVGAFLVEGCLGWLECRVLPDPHVLKNYDLLVGQVVAAWAEDSVFGPRGWEFTADGPATIHHVSGSIFTAPGRMLKALS